MANTFRNARKALATSVGGAVYTCPANTTAIVLHCQVANVHATDAADVTVYWTDSSLSASTYFADEISVANATSLAVITGKPVLEAGDAIYAMSSSSSSLEISVGVLEIS